MTAPGYFERFFDEKEIDYRLWEIEGARDVHLIDSDFVVELIKGTNGQEAETIERQLTVIDFQNGDVLRYLEHLARAYIATIDDGVTS
jgi:hypothetical protein